MHNVLGVQVSHRIRYLSSGGQHSGNVAAGRSALPGTWALEQPPLQSRLRTITTQLRVRSTGSAAPPSTASSPGLVTSTPFNCLSLCPHTRTCHMVMCTVKPSDVI